MKAEIWKIYVCNGTMDAIHNHFWPIFEVYVPDLKFAINKLNFFDSYPERYVRSSGLSYIQTTPPEKIGEFDLSTEDIVRIETLKMSKKNYSDLLQSFVKEIPDWNEQEKS